MDYYNNRQIELVEFGERVYHAGLRHKSINGGLYEDKLINFLRFDIPELNFFRGQIKGEKKSSLQYDIIICKKGVRQVEFLKNININVNVVSLSDCIGIIELKKYGNPKMISSSGAIEFAFQNFKNSYTGLKYFFVCFRFKDRKRMSENNWHSLHQNLTVDEKFCFWGNVYKEDNEHNFPWIKNVKLIERNRNYFGQYQKLVESIKNLI